MDFYWGFYFHESLQSGVEYYIRNLGNGWIPDHGPTGNISKSNFLCVLVQVGTVSEVARSALDEIMRSHDSEVNTMHGVTCRVWVLERF